MKNYFLLIAGGVDRKGIVFNLSKILKKHNFNIEDSAMLMLRHTFSVVMLLSNQERPEKKKLNKELQAFMKKFSMAVEISNITEKEMIEYKEEGNSYIISISGADRPGIVKTMTGILYKNGVNIIDLETKSSQKVEPAAYYMILEVAIPLGLDINMLERELKDAGRKIGVHVNINKMESSIL